MKISSAVAERPRDAPYIVTVGCELFFLEVASV